MSAATIDVSTPVPQARSGNRRRRLALFSALALAVAGAGAWYLGAAQPARGGPERPIGAPLRPPPEHAAARLIDELVACYAAWPWASRWQEGHTAWRSSGRSWPTRS